MSNKSRLDGGPLVPTDQIRWYRHKFKAFLKRRIRRFREPVECRECGSIESPIFDGGPHVGVCPSCGIHHEAVHSDPDKDYKVAYDPTEKA